jgi:plasmid stabilization system protein ParE
MKRRRVRFTATAEQHLEHERAWWLRNRDHQELFATELESAVRVLAILPGAGTPYRLAAIPELRRLYLRGIGCHVYYTFDDDEVLVRALWAARRERGPTLGG